MRKGKKKNSFEFETLCWQVKAMCRCWWLLISIGNLPWELSVFILYHTNNALLYACGYQSSL